MKAKSKVVVCHDIQGKLYKVKSDELSFRPSAYGIVIKNGKVLLSRQWDGYDFPGGGFEKHETIEQALIREVWEETGLKVKPGRLVYATTSFFKPPFIEAFWNCQLLYYLCTNPQGKISTAHFDEYERQYAQSAEWVDLKRLPKLRFYNSLGSESRRIIKEAMKIQGN